jgi:hypothetical protein
LAGAQRDRNPIYQVFRILTGPIVKGVRHLTRRVILDRHVPLAAFALLVVVWMAATLGKVNHCLRIGIEQCR